MIDRFFNRLIAIAFVVFIFGSSTLFFLIALVIWLLTRPFDRRLSLLHRFTCLWASLYVWIFPPWSVTIEGRDKIDPHQTYVIVSNHQSLVDILVAFTLFIHFKWVSKAEIFNIPLIGWNMFLNRYVRLKRGNRDSIVQMYEACERHLAEGSSVYLFPEGTRSVTGEMRQFKEGAFVLARRMGVPILPLVIIGSRDALPKASLDFSRTEITVRVLDEIDPATIEATPPVELAARVRETIGRHLPD